MTDLEVKILHLGENVKIERGKIQIGMQNSTFKKKQTPVSMKTELMT